MKFAKFWSVALLFAGGWLSGAPGRPAAPLTDGAVTVVAQINQFRRLAGLAPVEFDATLSQGGREHALYLSRNSKDPSVQRLGAHAQSPDLPGYTTAGAKAARNSDISFGRPPEACVGAWMATLYHRVPLLRPNLKRVGVGYEGDIVVADLISGMEGEVNASVVYPGDGQTQVPMEFGAEIPSPVPPNAPGPAGYPITLQFPTFGPQAANVRAELVDDHGKDVAFHLSDPEHPATFFTQQNTVCLIPVGSFAPGTVYTVKVMARVGDGEILKTWRFTTRPIETAPVVEAERTLPGDNADEDGKNKRGKKKRKG